MNMNLDTKECIIFDPYPLLDEEKKDEECMWFLGNATQNTFFDADKK